MHSRTIATLDRLERASWFSRVGINEGSDVAVVRSWSDAIHHCDSSAWEDLQGEALNQYREFIARRSKERLQLWNGLVDEVKEISRPLVGRKIAAAIRETIAQKYSAFRSTTMLPESAWKPNLRTCPRPDSSRALAIGM